MSRGKKYGPEEIIPKLCEAEVLMSQGTTQELAAKQIGVSDLPPRVHSRGQVRVRSGHPGEVTPGSFPPCERYSRKRNTDSVTKPTMDTPSRIIRN